MNQSKIDLSKTNIDFKFGRGFKTYAEKKSIELRTQMGLKPYEPMDAFKLCEFYKIPVLRPQEIKKLQKQHLDNLLGTGSDEWSAVTIPVAEKKYLIIHNNNHSPARQQSNLMHEMAHIIREHTTPETYKLQGLPTSLRNFNEEQENEAEWLGACLQLPRPALLWILSNKISLENASKIFTASESMIRYRINITGVQRQIHYNKSYSK